MVRVVDGREGLTNVDRAVADLLRRTKKPLFVAVNKVDTSKTEGEIPLAEFYELGFGEVFPVSAKRGTGIPPLVARLTELVPDGPLLYPPEERTDRPSEVHLAELIREQVLRRTREEQQARTAAGKKKALT